MSKITEKVKTFEDACEVLNIVPSIPDFSAMPEDMQKPLLAHFKLVIIAEALNEGWKPDWTNDRWDKWYPWFDMNAGSSSSGRFSSSAPLIGSRFRIAALAFASNLRSWQIMQEPSLKTCTESTL